MAGIRYVVVARSLESHVRVFGTFRDRARADALADKVNARLEELEEEEFQAWRVRSNHADHSGEMAPDGYGRAGVLIVHPPRYRRALAFAKGELNS